MVPSMLANFAIIAVYWCILNNFQHVSFPSTVLGTKGTPNIKHITGMNLTAQAQICFGTEFHPPQYTKNVANFLRDGLRQILDSILIHDVSRVVMRNNDPELES